jgi:hypothetical protein
MESRIRDYQRNKSYEQGKIYNSIKKYGFEAHTFEVIDLCNPEELDKLEIFYIDVYNTCKTSHGLNLTPGGLCPHIPRRAKALLPLTPVYAKCPNGEVKKFKSAFECAEVLSMGLQSIRRSCRLHRIHSGYAFSYTGDFSVKYKGTKERSDGKPIYLKCLDGKIVKYSSVSACTKELKTWNTALAKKIKSGKLFRGKYYVSHDPTFPTVAPQGNKVSKPVYAKDLKGEITKYVSFTECAKNLGLTPSTIADSIKYNKWCRNGYCFSRTPFEQKSLGIVPGLPLTAFYTELKRASRRNRWRIER